MCRKGSPVRCRKTYQRLYALLISVVDTQETAHSVLGLFYPFYLLFQIHDRTKPCYEICKSCYNENNSYKPRLNLTPEERKLRRKESKKEWELRNPDKVKAMKRKYLERHREQRYTYLKAWRASNLDKSRLKQRLTHWRTQQAKIAQNELRFSSYPSDLDSFSTFGLSELLHETITFINRL